MDILEISNDIEKKKITRYILEALPDWFGIPESREEYIEDSVGKIFFCAYKDEKPVGFFVSQTDRKRYSRTCGYGSIERIPSKRNW